MTAKNEKKPLPSPAPKKTKQPRTLEAKKPVESSNRAKGLTIVGIGASAGGLKALQSFFSALPADTGLAFVVVTHLHPEHESFMAELLQKHTQMPALQVTKRTRVEADHVYVIPPNRNILMTDGHLKSVPFDQPHGMRTPIDNFFRSQAFEERESVGVILSGGGTDGSVGIKDIKEVGGLILVQHPDDAEFDSMPRAAINTGLADFILPADQLARKLAEFAKHRPQLPYDVSQLTEQELETLQRILTQVHARTGHDFNQYKRSTVLRRVQRRMQLNGFLSLNEYLSFLRQNTNEAQAMFNDILIGVTNFFRDRDSWAALQEEVFPVLFANKDEQNEVRMWSIGCATGEEAYSLAILAFEEASKLDYRPHIQVFASDLDERSIAHARQALYPSVIEADVSPERLERFFTREGEYYRVKRELRDAVLFTGHNVLRDPPFSRQDLVVCRNVLIYLQRTIQDRVFDIFHYALNPNGYLFLGSSESAEHLPDLFHVLDKSHRIYQARPWTGEKNHVPAMPLAARRGPRPPEILNISRLRPDRYLEEAPVSEEFHQRALESYGPPSILVNARYAILHVSETAGRYLHQPKGPITGDILKLIQVELQTELRTALFQAFEKDKVSISRPILVQFNGHPHRVIISVYPHPDSGASDPTEEKEALVVFLEEEHEESLEAAESQPARTDVERNQLVAQLESEVQHLREQLQITIEEYDSSNEEMKAANEELQSINEEYRSATEELETSKEELQSVNEELQTLNSEIRNKLAEVSRAHAELENLMGATEIPTLYLDRELRIQRFTAGIRDLFNIMPLDRGRPLIHLTHKLTGYENLLADAEQVLHKLTPVEREAQIGGEGDTFLLRLRPYRTLEGHVEGVVITFIDISKQKDTERQLLHAKETLEERVRERTRELDEANQKASQARDLFHGLFTWNPIPTALTQLEDDVFLNVNTEFLRFFDLDRDQVIGHSAEEFDLGLGLRIKPRAQMITALEQEGRIQTFEAELLHPNKRKNVLVSVQLISLGSERALITTFIDITERVQAEHQIRSLAAEMTVVEQAERNRISQILHDDLQQRIFAVKMQLSMLQETLPQLDFTEIQESLDEAVSITRNLSIDLSPAILKGDGLADALSWLSAQMNEKHGLRTTLQTNGVSTKFDDTLRIVLFQSVREMLFNVVKHAGTLEAAIQIEKQDNGIQIIVKDNGRGFDTGIFSDKELNGMGGLTNIHHRLSLMGCNLRVKSHPGEGTQVTIDVPLELLKT